MCLWPARVRARRNALASKSPDRVFMLDTGTKRRGASHPALWMARTIARPAVLDAVDGGRGTTLRRAVRATGHLAVRFGAVVGNRASAVIATRCKAPIGCLWPTPAHGVLARATQ